MPLRLGALRDALLKPGDPALAQKAAEEVAAYDQKFADLKGEFADLKAEVGTLKWMVSVVVALVLGNLWLSFSILGRLPR